MKMVRWFPFNRLMQGWSASNLSATSGLWDRLIWWHCIPVHRARWGWRWGPGLNPRCIWNACLCFVAQVLTRVQGGGSARPLRANPSMQGIGGVDAGPPGPTHGVQRVVSGTQSQWEKMVMSPPTTTQSWCVRVGSGWWWVPKIQSQNPGKGQCEAPGPNPAHL